KPPLPGRCVRGLVHSQPAGTGSRAITPCRPADSPTVAAAGLPTQHLFLPRPRSARQGLGANTLMSFQPPLEKRLRRLDEMGANVEIRPTNRRGAAGMTRFKRESSAPAGG